MIAARSESARPRAQQRRTCPAVETIFTKAPNTLLRPGTGALRMLKNPGPQFGAKVSGHARFIGWNISWRRASSKSNPLEQTAAGINAKASILRRAATEDGQRPRKRPGKPIASKTGETDNPARSVWTAVDLSPLWGHASNVVPGESGAEAAAVQTLRDFHPPQQLRVKARPVQLKESGQKFPGATI